MVIVAHPSNNSLVRVANGNSVRIVGPGEDCVGGGCIESLSIVRERNAMIQLDKLADGIFANLIVEILTAVELIK
jgi:hypothetical protein